MFCQFIEHPLTRALITAKTVGLRHYSNTVCSGRERLYTANTICQPETRGK